MLTWARVGLVVLLGMSVAGLGAQPCAAVPAPKDPPQKKTDPVVIDNKSDGKTVEVVVGSMVEVRLAGTRPHTGWEGGSGKGDALMHLNLQKGQPGQKPSRPGLEPLPFGNEFLPDRKAEDRAIGTYVFIYQAVKVGRAELHMDYITPGGPGITGRRRSARIAQFKVTIDVVANAKGETKALTDQQMAELAKQTAQKGQFQELQDIRSNNQHLGAKWTLEQPLHRHRFWCVLHAYTPAAPVRSFIAVGRDGTIVSSFKAADFAKLLQEEDRSAWKDADYLHTASLYIHLTETSHQDGWKIVNAPAEFMAIKFNMFPQIEKKREEAARAIAKTTVVHDKDTVRVRLWSWHLIGGVLREWNVDFGPTSFKAASKELGRFGGGGYD